MHAGAMGVAAAQKKVALPADRAIVNRLLWMQETFGLTPLEAMAAGLPCVVSDWNGYRDTVRLFLEGVPTNATPQVIQLLQLVGGDFEKGLSRLKSVAEGSQA